MNRQDADLLIHLKKEKFVNQRILSETSGYSIGTVNKVLRRLVENDYLTESFSLTKKAEDTFRKLQPKNAVILAAGFGMRMVPINMHTPKGLLEVDGEPLIERLIKQLHDAGISEIYVIVGFMKEHFEYLIDEYSVKLLVNREYAERNNLHSLKLAARYLSNTYIIPSDLWCAQNPFCKDELYSWYMVSDLFDKDSSVRVNRKMELVTVPDNQGGNSMIGISYLTGEESIQVQQKLLSYDQEQRYINAFWEETLLSKNHMTVQAKVVHGTDFVEINTFEQLRELDEDSAHLKSDAITIIAESLHVNTREIVDIMVLKKGMTNRSFLFRVCNQRYIMRIPGEGTDQLINRKEEADVYDTISGRNICDDITYINPENGYKITAFLENSRVCDPENPDDLKLCMKKLKEFHNLKLKVDHEFNIYKQINFYESLWAGAPSVYRDYQKTKTHVFELRNFIEEHAGEKCLTHIDAVPDNFLFTEDGTIRLIDWEYAGMQDPHVDIAMFCIYALYDREQVDHLIDLYFEGECTRENRYKIYCLIAACGLLWSNWCEYKRSLGVEFGEYSLRQYRYAKEYYNIFKEEYDESR